jgi:hypothetical protein
VEHCEQAAGTQTRGIISRHPASGAGTACTEILERYCNDNLVCEDILNGVIDPVVVMEKTSSFKFNATISYDLYDDRMSPNKIASIYVCVSHTLHTEEIAAYSIDNDERFWMSLFPSTDDDVYASIGSRTFTGLSTGTCAITTLPRGCYNCTRVGPNGSTTKDGITETYNARIIKIDTDGTWYKGLTVPFSCTPETVNPCLNISSDVLVARSYEEDYTRNFSFNPNFNALELSKDTFGEDLVLYMYVQDWYYIESTDRTRVYRHTHIYHVFDLDDYNDNFDYTELPFTDDPNGPKFLYKDVVVEELPRFRPGRYIFEITKDYKIQTYDTGAHQWIERSYKFVSRIYIEPLLQPIVAYTKEGGRFISQSYQQLENYPDGFIGTPNGTPFLTQCEDECNSIDECAGFTIHNGYTDRNEDTEFDRPCHLKNNVADRIHGHPEWDLYTKTNFTYDAE